MRRTILAAVGTASVTTSIYMWNATPHWYDNIPGVAQTGPLKLHFAKDVALAYLASGAVLIWAGVKCDQSAGICGSMWLVLHALFHISVWVHRGLPLDTVALTNLAGVQLPAFLVSLSALKLQKQEAFG